MNIFRKINPAWALRIGLGMMYLYSGYDLFTKPHHWYSFVPLWFSQALTQVVAITTYLRVQGIGEMAIGFVFLAWFLPRVCVRLGSILAFLEMALIVLFVGIDPITFRDIGLLGAALALSALTVSKDLPKETSDHVMQYAK